MRVLMLDGGDRTPYLGRLFTNLAGKGVAVHYAGDERYKDFAALEAAGVSCHAVSVRHKLDFSCRRRVRRLLDEHGIQILHTITGRDAYVGIKARGRRPIKTFVRRGAYATVSRLDPADRAVYGKRGADRFIVVSKSLARHLESRGLDAARITPVYTGVWSDDLQPVQRNLRAEYGIDAGAYLLGYVGNQRPVKGFDILLDALLLLKKRGVLFHLLVAGDGHAASSIRGLEDHVTLLGHVPDIMTFTPNVDCLVFSSRIDACPRGAIEATVVGTPVVGTRVGGIPEILDEGNAGVLVDPLDPGALADGIAAAAADPERMERLAAAALARNRALFSVDRCAQTHVRLYSEALA